MKKLNREQKERIDRLTRKRFSKYLKRKQGFKRFKIDSYRQKILSQKQKSMDIKAKKQKHSNLIAPSNFSLINNPIETLTFFDKLRKCMLDYKPVHVDMKSISSMTVDALVYYLAVLEQVKTKRKKLLLKGSIPTDDIVLLLMKRSGFLKYFETKNIDFKPHNDIIEIKSGNFVDNETVKNICIFVMNKFNIDRTKTSKLYQIIIEMMQNTKNHAYSNEMNDYNNWLIFIIYYPERNSINFIFMDTGYGIPQTVRKNHKEKIKELLSKIRVSDFSETKIVKSALNGDFRTQTGQGYRGKGLPRIYKYVKIGYIKKFNLFSNKACITENTESDLPIEMIGTLYFWQLTKESVNADDIN